MGDRPLAETQAFFSVRAATWDARFPGDEPAYARAVADLAPPVGGRVLDLGSGTGRAVLPLHRAVGPDGSVIALDATWEMQKSARAAGRHDVGRLVLADATRLPLADHSIDAIFAAGIIHHLPAPHHGLDEVTRVNTSHARLAVFHPVGRRILAARRNRARADDGMLAAANLAELLDRHGWRLLTIDDGDDRYLAVAERN
jgi:SAM-dependent methyltransferase